MSRNVLMRHIQQLNQTLARRRAGDYIVPFGIGTTFLGAIFLREWMVEREREKKREEYSKLNR